MHLRRALPSMLALIGVASAVLVPVASGSGAVDPQRQAQLVIFVEVPAGEAPATRLVLDGIRLAAETDTLALEPLRHEFDARALAGRQVRLLEQALGPGVYSSLHLEISGIETRLGAATIRPDPPAEGVRLDLDLRLDAGDAELLVLRWVPRSTSTDTLVYRPNMELIEPRVPPLGSLAFVTNEGSANVGVIDRATWRVVDIALVGDRPRGLAYAAGQRQLYVAVAGSGEIVVVDALTFQPFRRLALSAGGEPTRLLLAEDADALFVLDRQASIMTVLNASSLQEEGRIQLGERPRDIVRERRSGRVFVSSELGGEILVYDPLQREVVATLAVDPAPGELAFSDAEETLFVASATRRRQLTVPLGASSASGAMNLCGFAAGLAHDPFSGKLYVAIPECRAVVGTRPERGLELGSISLPGRPGLLTFDPEYRWLLVTLPEDDSIAVCSPNQGTVATTLEVGSRPYMVVFP